MQKLKDLPLINLYQLFNKDTPNILHHHPKLLKVKILPIPHHINTIHLLQTNRMRSNLQLRKLWYRSDNLNLIKNFFFRKQQILSNFYKTQ